MAPNKFPFKAFGRRHEPAEPSQPRPVSAASASSSHAIDPPMTPQPLDEPADTEYFPTLSAAPSVQSRLSAAPSISLFPPVSSASSRPRSFGERTERPANESRRNSIRLRRYSGTSLRSASNPNLAPEDCVSDRHGGSREGGRPRSISQPEGGRLPEPAVLARHSRRAPQMAMPRLTEEGGRPSMAELGIQEPAPAASDRSVSPCDDSPIVPETRTRMQRARQMSRVFWPGGHHHQNEKDAQPFSDPNPDDEYAEELVDWLDMIDPEVQTLSTLTNVQNSLFIPDLGNWVNRRPTYTLSQHGKEQEWARGAIEQQGKRRDTMEIPTIPEQDAPPLERSTTISSRLTDSHYAALPHGTSLEGWTDAEKLELDDHVRHMLHSRRARLKRSFKGFGQYVRRPLGFFVTLYATLITLFGLAWVLFLIGWIYVGEEQVYAIHIIDSVLVALFAIMGDGLAPFRAVDTYHMIFIARYKRMIKRVETGKGPRSKIQKKSISAEERNSIDQQAAGRLSFHQARQLMQGPPVEQIPATTANTTAERNDEAAEADQTADLENSKSAVSDDELFPLTYKQLKSLQHHQKKFAKSHSFYKPHETFTHHPFPNAYLIAIVILLDCHSCLQISLGACTWGIDYHTRPFAITTVILCVSITCNVTAGILISMGDKKTRKKDVMELLNRQELTSDAMKLVKGKKKSEDGDKEQELDSSASGSGSGSGSRSRSGSGSGDRARESEDKGERRGSAKLKKVLS